MKRGEDDVSLFDGGLFMVRRRPYAQHLASAPDKQPVCSSHTSIIVMTLTECNRNLDAAIIGPRTMETRVGNI